ncbi:hypothetical protein BIW11_03018 [Tropilaelaps mercedesae]|uniref:Uncharacterized protein n=1 Tax=Tropilaelaps mercedesae TaxID=418985 RepID=A0A1V9XTF0_9ACAR|nr:hypothetical protein BIW11_03018 [Tropilaelaps mercedesae]
MGRAFRTPHGSSRRINNDNQPWCHD